MSNSNLVNYTKISPNSSNPRSKAISKITIHHMAGNLSIETCGNVFAPTSRQASSNYGIGTDGRVGMYVEEKNRAWTSSSSANDNMAVTIEVANSQCSGVWPVSDAAYAKLIDLCVDICQRNGIKNLNWTGDSTGNLTCHYMFAATSCPGPYLKSKMPEIANLVNARLNGTTSAPIVSKPAASTSEMYRVRKSWADAASQIGAYTVLENAKKACTSGYTVYNSAGQAVYSNVPAPATPAKKSNEEIAKEVLAGKWGNGQDRKNRLEAAGYNYQDVQNIVNGNVASTPSAPAKKSVDEIAREVIRGDWGNGQDRKNRLAAAGYSYSKVQAAVNRLL